MNRTNGELYEGDRYRVPVSPEAFFGNSTTSTFNAGIVSITSAHNPDGSTLGVSFGLPGIGVFHGQSNTTLDGGLTQVIQWSR